jgi:hypothetical protein
MLGRRKRLEIMAAEKAINAEVEDVNEAYEELEKVKNQKLRTDIAIRALNPNISYLALARIESKELLEKVVRETPHKATRKFAEDMLKNMQRT